MFWPQEVCVSAPTPSVATRRMTRRTAGLMEAQQVSGTLPHC